MMKCFRIIAALAVCLALGACGDVADKIAVTGFALEKFKDVGVDGSQLSFVTNLVLDADNKSGHNIEIKKCSAVLYNKRGRKIASATSDDSTRHMLRRRRSGEVIIPLNIEFANAMTAITMVGLNIDKIEDKEYTLDYDCVVKIGSVSKRFKEKRVPVAELMEYLQR